MKKLTNSIIFKTLCMSKKQILIVAVGIAFLAILFLFLIPIDSFTKLWERCLEASITFLLLLVAIFIWYNEQKQDFVDALPKRLTVHFLYGNEYVMTCYDAFLSSESDIRLWGQQIGRQMSWGDLSFFPYIEQNKRKISSNKDYVSYEVFFFLRNINNLNNPGLNTQYLVWKRDPQNNYSTQECWFNDRPKYLA